MYTKTYYATHPSSLDKSTNDELRDRYLIDDLFANDQLRLNYLHYERFIVGGAAPIAEPVWLPVQQEPASAKDKPFLERRELGVVNVGASAGVVKVDGEQFQLEPKDGLYIPMGASDVTFESAEYDESAFQRQLTDELGTEHDSIACSARDIAESFPAVVEHAERPLVRTGPAPLYRLAKLVRERGIKVVLTGEGADVVLAQVLRPEANV